jgi:putative redox protein
MIGKYIIAESLLPRRSPSPSGPDVHLMEGCRAQPLPPRRRNLEDTMEMIVTLPGGARVDAQFGAHTIKTDQPPRAGGEGSAPAPFSLFLASIGTCAGIYVAGFCAQRGLPTDGIRIVQRMKGDPGSGMAGKIELDIQVPPDFPQKYYDSLVRAANQCAVKKHLEKPPSFEVRTVVAEATEAA